jgi:hypothetical protein
LRCGPLRGRHRPQRRLESLREGRAWFAFAKGAKRFRLPDGSGMSEYRWTPPGEAEPHLAFTFCRICGVRTFARS